MSISSQGVEIPNADLISFLRSQNGVECSHVDSTLFKKALPFLTENFGYSQETVIRSLFSTNEFQLSVLDAYAYDAITVTDWERSNCCLQRRVRFSASVKAPIIGKKITHIEQEHFLFLEKDDYVLEIHSSTKGVPFADSFVTLIRLRTKIVSEDSCQIELSNVVKFLRAFPAKGTVEKAAQSTNEEFYKNWFIRAHGRLEGREMPPFVISEYVDKDVVKKRIAERQKALLSEKACSDQKCSNEFAQNETLEQTIPSLDENEHSENLNNLTQNTVSRMRAFYFFLIALFGLILSQIIGEMRMRNKLFLAFVEFNSTLTRSQIFDHQKSMDMLISATSSGYFRHSWVWFPIFCFFGAFILSWMFSFSNSLDSDENEKTDEMQISSNKSVNAFSNLPPVPKLSGWEGFSERKKDNNAMRYLEY